MTETTNTLDPTDEAAVGAAIRTALAAIADAGDLDRLKAVRLAHTGEKSPLALANRAIGALPKASKGSAGRLVGAARREVAEAVSAREQVLVAERDARMLVDEAVDVTLPYDRRRAGARHPVATIMEEVADIFVAMGWEIADGPELETEWYNFDALNFAPDHPARAMQDTFYIAGPEEDGGAADGSGLVLRTHTSPVQIRTMLRRPPPIYVACPGRV